MNKLRTVIIFFLLSFTLSFLCFASDVKDADLAGVWYPADATDLSAMLTGYLHAADVAEPPGRPFAIIVPHAGYRFSGKIAAYGYKAAANARIASVVLLGFSHRKPFNGIAIYDRGSFRTPLGEIIVDTELARVISRASPRFIFAPDAFVDENSVEMQLPFIQLAFPGAKVVPIAFGGMEYADAVAAADALASALRGRDDCLVVASTDLSHYHPYEDANAIDKHLLAVLRPMKGRALYDEARLGICELCGVMPVTATLLAAERLGFDKIEILSYANSGDTSGKKDSVVGYVSAVIYKGQGGAEQSGAYPEGARVTGQGDDKKGGDMFTDSQRKRLLEIARESMTAYVKDGKRKNFTDPDPLLNQELGAFVTIHERGELRGCIGSMTGKGPLYKTVANMAIEAATGDPRFPRLSPAELGAVDVEVSVLTPLKKVRGPEEIRIPGQGVIVRRGSASGVYLPQVATETGWSKEEFLTSLCAQKAGIAPDAWKDPATELYTFEAVVFGEKEAGAGR